VARYYPEKAARDEVEGRATLSCDVSAEGTLAGCKVISEDPVGYGFGDAAMGLSPLFRMGPQTREGQPVAGGTVRIPIRFVLPRGPESTPPSVEIIKRCYRVAAEALGKDSSNQALQSPFFLWRMIFELRLLSEKVTPSELDAQLQALGQSREPTTAADRKFCEGILPANLAPGFGTIIEQLGKLPAR
jgi:TonB family protein